MYYHPNHYKKLKASSRKPYRSRPTVINRIHDSWATDHGYGSKDQAIQETVPHNDIEEASSLKPQAVEASSSKPQAPRTKLQAPSRKRQAP